MMRQWTRCGKLRHAHLAWAVICALVLQTALSSHALHPRHGMPGEAGVESAVAFAQGEICDSAAGDPAKHAGRDHSDCCVLCQPIARDAALFVAAVWASVAVAPSEAAEPELRRPAPDDPRPPSTGFASAWSSRAPPYVS